MVTCGSRIICPSLLAYMWYVIPSFTRAEGRTTRLRVSGLTPLPTPIKSCFLILIVIYPPIYLPILSHNGNCVKWDIPTFPAKPPPISYLFPPDRPRASCPCPLKHSTPPLTLSLSKGKNPHHPRLVIYSHSGCPRIFLGLSVSFPHHVSPFLARWRHFVYNS
jgi:hypothetical protein